MSEVEVKLKEQNEIYKELYNYNGGEDQLKHLKEVFTNFIKNSNNESYVFISLLDFYSKCRPWQHRVSKELVECIYSCFPEQIDDVQNCIEESNFLNCIIFPEEFPMEENKEQYEMLLLLQKDDIDGFISFLSNHPTIDIISEQELGDGYYYSLFGCKSISLIDFCCFFGSLKCFKYLLLNKCEITGKTLYYSIAGGNQEIIGILLQNGYTFEEFLTISVKYHRYELTNWLNENYECEYVPLPTCIIFENIDAFLYFFEHGHSLDETGENAQTCLHVAAIYGSLLLVQYLIEKGANIESKTEDQFTSLHYASSNGNTNVVKYLLSKGANKNAQNEYGETPSDVACSWIGDQSKIDIIRDLLK